MPLPTPAENETQQEFISRCMGDETMNDEYPDREQRAAVCYSQWRRSKGKSLAPLDPGTRYEKTCTEPRFKVAENDAGWIEGYAAAFNNVDHQGERIRPGAFKKTIKERVPAGKVKLMVRHYAQGGDTLEVIGTVTEAKEDDFGLWIHAELSSAEIAQETRRKILEGHVNNLSIGYIPKKWTDVEEQGKTIRELHEVMLLEVTVTTIPANELATITAAKAVMAAAEAVGRDVGAPDAKEGRVLSAANRSRIQSVLKALSDLATELRRLLKEAEPRAPKGAALHSWLIKIKRRHLELQRLALGAKAFRHNSETADSEPAWSKVDKTKLPRIAFADMGEPDKVSTWRFPHHWVKDGGNPDANGRYTTGTLYLHKGGLNAAWAAAQGARSGQEASAAVKTHLQKHRKALGLD